MSYSIGAHTCENDPTHETCELCGYCQACNEDNEARYIESTKALEIFERALGKTQTSDELKEDLLSSFTDELRKETYTSVDIETLPIIPFYAYLDGYIKHVLSQNNDEGWYSKIEETLNHFLVTKCKEQAKAIDKFYYVDWPTFMDELNDHDNDTLLVALLCVLDKSQREPLISALFLTLNDESFNTTGLKKHLETRMNYS